MRGKALSPGLCFKERETGPSRAMALRDDYLREDIFSDSYLDAFYKAHVAARSGRGDLDEDIAAIEAEIGK